MGNNDEYVRGYEWYYKEMVNRYRIFETFSGVEDLLEEDRFQEYLTQPAWIINGEPIVDEQVAKQISEFDIALAKLERAVLHSIETSNDRVAVHEMLLHLIVGGNVLMYVADEGLKCFHLNKYVLRRDPMGNPLEAIVNEKISIENLPDSARELVDEKEGEVTGIVDEKG